MTDGEIEPDAWQHKDQLGNFGYTEEEKEEDYFPYITEQKPLYSAETIQEVINKQITHHEKIKVDAWKKFEDTAYSEVRERAEKHSEIIASLKEVREVFSHEQ